MYHPPALMFSLRSCARRACAKSEVVFARALSLLGILAAGLNLLAPSASAAVAFPLRWHWSNPAPHGNNIVDISHSSSLELWVEVGERGQIYTSYDLDLWTSRDSGTIKALRAVTFFGSRVIITGESGTVLYADSLDAFQTGTISTGATSDWLEAVAASSTRVVAVGDNGAIYASNNGATWMRQTTAITGWFRGVTFGNGTFVAVGENGLIASSLNGLTWTTRTSGTARHLNRVTHGAARFTVVGDAGVVLASTTGGTSWVPLNSGATNDLLTVADANNVRLVGGAGELRTEINGIWSNELNKNNAAPPWTYLSSVARSDFFLVGGRTGLMSEGYRTNSSPFFWIPTDDSPRDWLFDIAALNGLYVAVGDHAIIMSSANGIDWSSELVPATATNTTFLGVGGNTNLLIAVGNAGALLISRNTLTNIAVTNISGTNIIITNQTVSTFGIAWQAIAPRPTTNELQGVCSFGDLYVVTGGNGTVLTSADGTNWVAQETGTSSILSSVAASTNMLVATGEKGTILSSPDAVTWTPRLAGNTNWIYRVRFLAGQFIAVGQNGTIFTSADGMNWSPQISGSTRWLNDVTFVDDTFFAIGTQGAVLSSTDAILWTDRGAITQKSLYGAATAGNQLIVVGIEGVILRSQVVPDLSPVNILQFSRLSSVLPAMAQNLYLFGGKPDQRFTLNFRSTLTTNVWSTGAQLEFYDSSGTLYYLESSPGTNFPSLEFYRTTLRP